MFGLDKYIRQNTKYKDDYNLEGLFLENEDFNVQCTLAKCTYRVSPKECPPMVLE